MITASSPNRKFINVSSLRQLEYIYTLVGLFFFSNGLVNILKSAGASALETPLRYSILGVAVLVLLNQSKSTLITLRRGLWALPVIGLNCISFLWSASSPLSMESIRAEFIPITIFGIYLAMRFSYQEMLKILYTYAFLTLFISLFYIFGLPNIGRHPVQHVYAGAWKGIFIHKNTFGFNLSILSTLLELKILYSKRKTIFKWGLLLIITTVSIILSQSLGALIISVLALLLTALYQKYQWKGQTSVLVLQSFALLVLTISAALTAVWEPLLGLFGKSATIGGRTLIWEFLLAKVSNVPLLGFGRGTFWKVPALFSGIFQATGDSPANAHNGYIELLLETGYIGLILFIISAIFTLSKVLKFSYQAKRVEELWPITFMFLFLIWNISESFLLRGASLPWILYIFLTFSPLGFVQKQKVSAINPTNLENLS